MTQDEIIDMARQAGFVDYELDDGTTNAFDKRYEAFAKLVAKKSLQEALAQPETVTYSGNGTAGREADARPTGFFFQMPPGVGQKTTGENNL